MASRLSFSVRRRIRRRAREFAGCVSGVAPLETVEQLARSSGAYLDADVRLVRESLAEGRLADSRRSGGSVTIRLSPVCTTEFHTVAHELGHLVLKHSHVSVRCMEQDSLEGPGGFERIHLAFFGAENQELREIELTKEEEAELFACELMERLSTVNEPEIVRRWATGI